MNKDQLFESMTDIDENYVADARIKRSVKRRPAFSQWIGFAASLCAVIIGLSAMMPHIAHFFGKDDIRLTGDPVAPLPTEVVETEKSTSQNNEIPDESNGDLISACDGYDDLLKASFFFGGDSYKAATISVLEAHGLLDAGGNYMIPPEKNVGDYLGNTQNTVFSDMDGLKIFEAESVGETEDGLVVVELSGPVYEYYCKNKSQDDDKQ